MSTIDEPFLPHLESPKTNRGSSGVAITHWTIEEELKARHENGYGGSNPCPPETCQHKLTPEQWRETLEATRDA